MGLFQSYVVVVNTNKEDPHNTLKTQLQTYLGDISPAENNSNERNVCTMLKSGLHTVVQFPGLFSQAEQVIAGMSMQLRATLVYFSIYDGDTWRVAIFEDGELTAQYIPNPRIFEEAEILETNNQDFSASKFSGLFDVDTSLLQNYFIPWSTAIDAKAYQDDHYSFGDCLQLMDLMRKTGIVLNEQRDRHNIWTAAYPLSNTEEVTIEDIRNCKRYREEMQPISNEDITYIFHTGFGKFMQDVTYHQICLNCDDFDVERVNPTFMLNANQMVVVVGGQCKQCGHSIDAGWGIQDLARLKVILSK